MKLDLNYLNRFSKIEVDEDIVLSESFLEKVHVSGRVEIDFEDSVNLNFKLTGIMVLPCAVTLEDVFYEFETEIEENIGKFDEIYKNNKNTLEISEILWENIVLEIPIRVVSRNSEPSNTSGDGWELISE